MVGLAGVCGVVAGGAMAEPAHPAHDSNRNSTVIAANLRADLKSLLKQDRIRLWDPPYTSVGSNAHKTPPHRCTHLRVALLLLHKPLLLDRMKHASTRACCVIPHTIFLICMYSWLNLGFVDLLLPCASEAPQAVPSLLLIECIGRTEVALHLDAPPFVWPWHVVIPHATI